MGRTGQLAVGALVLALAAGAAACGGDDGGTDPSPTPNPATTITITTSGTSPKNLTVPRGSQVTFVNNDTRARTMSSNPHPAHTDCPELGSIGLLNPNQSRSSANLNTARTCGYHDHTDENNTNVQGTITIQ